jgi:hypothetical protein
MRAKIGVLRGGQIVNEFFHLGVTQRVSGFYRHVAGARDPDTLAGGHKLSKGGAFDELFHDFGENLDGILAPDGGGDGSDDERVSSEWFQIESERLDLGELFLKKDHTPSV